MRLVDLVAIELEVTTGAPLVLLREHDAPHRVVPILVGGNEGVAIALAATGQHASRPLTHDLMATLVQSLDGHVDGVEVTELEDGHFVASLKVSGPTGELQIDTRPSDAIALAVRFGAPLFVSEAVLDEAGEIIPEALDDDAIEGELEEFREFLDDLYASDFANPGDPPSEIGGDEAGPDPESDSS